MPKIVTGILFYLCASLPVYAQLRDVREQTALGNYLGPAQWEQLFPNRCCIPTKPVPGAAPAKDFYNYDALLEAASHFPAFMNEGSDTLRKQELAAFLAHIAQETSGGWAQAPGGYYKWGLYFKEEQGCENGCPVYSDTTKKSWPPVTGVSYHGRGPKQLSWNYNYGQFSEAWYGSKDTLLQHPERITEDPVLAFASALWFWMTPQPPKPSCHDVMTGKWTPTARDSAANRRPGFGTTVNIVNGGIECGLPHPLDKTIYRYAYYHYFCTWLQVPAGDNADCNTQRPFTE
jgi:hypothetical protein